MIQKVNQKHSSILFGRVNKCHRAVIKYAAKAVQPFCTAGCPQFRFDR